MLGVLEKGAVVGANVNCRWQQVCEQRIEISRSDRQLAGIACSWQRASPPISKGLQWSSDGASVGATDGTDARASAGVGATDVPDAPMPASASGSQHSAAQMAATSASVAHRSAVASIAQNSRLPMLMPHPAPAIGCSSGWVGDCVGDGVGVDGAATALASSVDSSCRR